MSNQISSLSDLLMSLLDTSSTYSTDEVIRNEVSESLKTISAHQPNVLLTACHHYLLQNPKLPAQSRAFVLQSIATCIECCESLDELDEQLILLIINLATQEMNMTRDSDTEWAESAKEVLLTLGRNRRFVTHVIDAILQKFPPGQTVSPHRYIVLTMATIAQHNPFGLVPFLIDILSRTVPLLQHVKTDPLRCAWCRAICSFCEAVRECETERPQEAHEENDSDGNSVTGNSGPGSVVDLSQEISHRAAYKDQAESIYDVVFNWIYSKDAKTRGEAAECIGELCLMISQAKLVDDVKKIINYILPLYKKSYNEAHMITQGVCRFLEASCMDDVVPLDAYLEDILNALFPNSCIDPDDPTITMSPMTIKNHSEAFRCFEIAATRFADRIVYYLLHKMQNVSDSQKLGAINVLRHLLNSAGQYMEDKRSLVMMGLKKLLLAENSASIKVKRAIVQLCVALADHAYVDTDGGDYVISFLVRNLVGPSEQEIQAKRVEVDVASNNQLRTQSAQALHTIASTCICANKLLWPCLLEFICAERYTPVVGDICKCIRTLLNREIEEGREIDYSTGFDNSKVAGRHAVFARLFTCLCNAPLNGFFSRRAREAGGLITTLSTWFHEKLASPVEKWSQKLEPLLNELSQTTANSPTGESPPSELRGRKIARWHEACLEWLGLCVSSVPEGEWRQEVAAAMGKQLDIYKEMSDEKSFLLRCLGMTLSKITAKTFVTDHLMLMFKSTSHASPVERQGCARAVGAVASNHIDLVIIELENVSKWEHARRSTGIFGFIKDTMPMRQYPDIEMVNLRATLMLCYGHVVMACSADTVPQRLQQTIMVFLRNYFANTKQETVVREAMLETMRLIACAIHPSRIGSDWKFEARNELLAYVKDYLSSESPEMLTSSLRLLAAKATAALVQLEPPLSDSDTSEICHTLMSHILPMCREKSGLKTLAYDIFDFASASVISTIGSMAYSTNSATIAEGMNGTPIFRQRNLKMDDDESATIMDATVHQFGLALEQIVRMKPTTSNITILLKMLQGYYGSAADHERSRAIDATVLILRVYYECAEDITLGRASDFAPLSSLLARLSPRIVDSLAHVRLQALSVIHWTLRLAYMHKGHGRDADQSLFSYAEFVENYMSTGEGKPDGQAAKRAIKAIAQIIELRLPQSQMQTYLTAIFDMLMDRQSLVSSAAAQLLTYALTARGATLVNEADKLVTSLVTKLCDEHISGQTYTDVLAALIAYAVHQQQAVCDVLLRQPLPYSVNISDAWECLSRDKLLFAGVLDYLIEMLSASLDHPFEIVDSGGGSSAKLVNEEPCRYIAAISEVIKNGEPEEAFIERLPVIMALFIHFICSVSDTQFPVMQKDGKKMLVITPELRRAAEKPAGMAVVALKNLLMRTRSETIINDMNQERAWSECLDKDNFIRGLTVLMRSLVEQRPSWVPLVSRSLEEYATNECEPRRLASVICASSLIRNIPIENGGINEQLLIKCVRRLEESLTDPSLRIRKLCVKGLGDLSRSGSADVVQRFVAMAVDAAMAGLDDHGDLKDMVAIESIVALNKLVRKTTDDQLVSILPMVLLKIRPCFEKESPELRSASFELFGELGSRVGEKSDEFRGHLHTNIVSILLHMNDDDELVRKNCAMTLYRLHELLISSNALICIERELPGGKEPACYNGFIKQIAMIMSNSYPDRVNQYALTTSNYYKSSSARIRANAALLTGCLLEGLSTQLRATISRELIFTGLGYLLKDPEDVNVRIAATKAIACLYDFH